MTALAVTGNVEQMPAPAQPMTLVERLAAQNFAPEAIEKVMDLADRQRATEAKRIFDEAFSRVTAEMPTVLKAKRADRYDYAGLDDVVASAREVLGRHGFSLRWRRDDDERAGHMRMVCIIAHAAGHREETWQGGPVEGARGTNAAQAIGTAQSYYSRYALMAALGIVTSKDTDGVPPRAPQPVPYHDERPFDDLDLIEETIAKAQSIDELATKVKPLLSKLPKGPERQALIGQAEAKRKQLEKREQANVG